MNEQPATQEPWPEGPLHPPLPLSEVHVWMADILSASRDRTEGLSDEERQRAQAARSVAYRVDFVQSRHILRDLLGRYLNWPPSEIALQIGEHGKPSLVRPAAEPALHFNLSHSNGTVLLAFACGREVGIDIDRLDRMAAWQSAAQRSCSEKELAALGAVPESERRDAFMRCWARKEAYSKARGMGFKYGFTRFTVSLENPGSPSLLLADDHDPAARDAWLLTDVTVKAPLVAALAIQDGTTQVRYWRYGR